MSVQPLFTPVRMGDLDLPNRIVMAPLTRMRARSIDHVPTALQAEYYAQRASAGLIVAEATAISPDGFGWADTPGLWSAEQVPGMAPGHRRRAHRRGPDYRPALAHRRHRPSGRARRCAAAFGVRCQSAPGVGDADRP
jgi:2,4-dienoyl-CoA reductase-like NADH-dependent reductase (Old Yellow Enzyme family)